MLCPDCGGPRATPAPIDAFVCVHCHSHADYSDPILPAPSGLSCMVAAASRREQLKPLIRGRLHILSVSLRSSTRGQYSDSRRSFIEFCRELDVAPFPCSPAMLMDFAVYCIHVKQLDSSTMMLKLRAVGAFYDYVRTRLCFRHVRSPLRDPELLELTRSLGANFKKAGGGRIAISAAELVGLFRLGFVTRTRRGRWARLFGLCLNFAMLRSTAVGSVRVCYSVSVGADGTEFITFLPGSEVSISYDASIDGEAITFTILSDKNVDARRAAEDGGRRAYVPGALPHLGIFFASELRSYLLDLRPPSGGPLLLYPDKKGHGFSVKPSRSFNTYLREAYRRAFPDVLPEYLQRLGSHSGRKTLAQLLWDAGFSRQLIATAGGWFIKREAVDLYFRTSAALILKALLSLTLDVVTVAGPGPMPLPPHQRT